MLYRAFVIVELYGAVLYRGIYFRRFREKIIKKVLHSLCMYHIIIKHKGNDFLAQLVEQLTLNQWVEGSSPSEVTIGKLSKRAVFLCFVTAV